MLLERILNYSNQAQSKLYGFLEDHESVISAEFDTISEFNTIGKLLAHTIGSEIRWTKKGIYGQDPGPKFEDSAPQDLNKLLKTALQARELTTEAFTSDLSREVTYPMPHWNHTAKMTAEEILFHVFNHEAIHRGQISMALQGFRIDPPNFDFPFFSPA